MLIEDRVETMTNSEVVTPKSGEREQKRSEKAESL